MQEAEPVVNEGFAVFAGGAEVYESNLTEVSIYKGVALEGEWSYLTCLMVPEEIRPIWVSLHHSEREQLLQAQVNNTRCDLRGQRMNE